MELRAMDCWKHNKFIKKVDIDELISVFGSFSNFKRLVNSGTSRQFIINNLNVTGGYEEAFSKYWMADETDDARTDGFEDFD